MNHPFGVSQRVINDSQVREGFRIDQVQLVLALKLHQERARTVTDTLRALGINGHRAGGRRQRLGRTAQTVLGVNQRGNRRRRGVQQNNLGNLNILKGQRTVRFSCATHGTILF